MTIPQALLRLSAVTASRPGDSNGVRLEVTNWNEILKTLGKLDKEYVKQLRKDFKAIARPVQESVKSAIPSKANPPMSGMRQVHFGRLAWGSRFGAGSKPSKSVLVQVPSTRSRRARSFETFSIARLQIGSPGTVLFDMAGRKDYIRGRKGFTPEYDYMYTINGQKVPGKRKHRVVPLAYAKGLGQSSGRLKIRASRIVWPAAEKALPAAQAAMELRITQVNLRINALLRSK